MRHWNLLICFLVFFLLWYFSGLSLTWCDYSLPCDRNLISTVRFLIIDSEVDRAAATPRCDKREEHVLSSSHSLNNKITSKSPYRLKRRKKGMLKRSPFVSVSVCVFTLILVLRAASNWNRWTWGGRSYNGLKSMTWVYTHVMSVFVCSLSKLMLM